MSALEIFTSFILLDLCFIAWGFYTAPIGSQDEKGFNIFDN